MTMVLREAAAADGPAYAELAANGADGGAVRFAHCYQGDAVEAVRALRPGVVWILAEEAGRIVGSAHLTFGDSVVEGERRRHALLSGRVVHPAHRRRGIGRAMLDWQLERAGDAVVLGNVQEGNAASHATHRHWAQQIVGPIVTVPVRASRTRPRTRYAVREPVSADEWAAAASGRAAFERGWNFHVPATGESLAAWAAYAPFGRPIRRYLVALEGSDVVAGAELTETAQALLYRIDRLPPALRMLNLGLRVVPPGGVMRQISVAGPWFAPGRRRAARDLIAHARWAYRDAGNTLLLSLDARSALRDVMPVGRLTPKAVLGVAVRSPVPLDEQRLLAPLL